MRFGLQILVQFGRHGALKKGVIQRFHVALQNPVVVFSGLVERFQREEAIGGAQFASRMRAGSSSGVDSKWL